MQVKRLRNILWLTTAIAGAGSGLALVAAFAWPLDANSEAAEVPSARLPASRPAGQAERTIPELASFEPAWTLPLRRPLVDPAPPPAALLAGPQRPRVRLIGTIVDGQRARGVFLIGLNIIEVKAIGESAGGATIAAIDAESATILFEGQSILLKREKKPFDPSGESVDAALRSPPAVPTKEEPVNGS